MIEAVLDPDPPTENGAKESTRPPRVRLYKAKFSSSGPAPMCLLSSTHGSDSSRVIASAGPYAAGIPKQEIIKRKNALLSAFGLSNLTHLHPFELPSVLRKRLAICATLAMGCPFYVFDEPTIWQDKKSAEAIIQILKQISSLGVGIIIISHSEWIKKQFAATNLYLEDGIIKN